MIVKTEQLVGLITELCALKLGITREIAEKIGEEAVEYMELVLGEVAQQ